MDNLECVAINLYEEKFQGLKEVCVESLRPFPKRYLTQTCVGSHIVIVVITINIIIVSIGDIFL